MCVVTNILLHIPEDIKHFSSTFNFWCFPFERAVKKYTSRSSNCKHIEVTYATAEFLKANHLAKVYLLHFTLPFQPTVVGVAAFPLKRVLQSDSLSSSASLQIKLAEHSKCSESSSSSLLHHTSGPSVDCQFTGSVCGPLLVCYFSMVIQDLLHR